MAFATERWPNTQLRELGCARAILQDPNLSDRDLAKMAGVTHPKIAQIRRKLEAGWEPTEDDWAILDEYLMSRDIEPLSVEEQLEQLAEQVRALGRQVSRIDDSLHAEHAWSDRAEERVKALEQRERAVV
jgi:hypothetical protein